MSFQEESISKIVKKFTTDKMLKWKQEEAEKAKKGWFGGWGFGATKSGLSDDEKLALEQFVADNTEDTTQLKIPKDYNWLSLKFEQKKGSFTLAKVDTDQTRKPSAAFTKISLKALANQKSKGRQARAMVTVDKTEEINLMVLNFGIDLFMRSEGMDLYIWIEDLVSEYRITLDDGLGHPRHETITIFRKRGVAHRIIPKTYAPNEDSQAPGLKKKPFKRQDLILSMAHNSDPNEIPEEGSRQTKGLGEQGLMFHNKDNTNKTNLNNHEDHYICVEFKNQAKNPDPEKDKGVIHIDVKLRVKTSEITYNERSIKTLMDIFSPDAASEELKGRAGEAGGQLVEGAGDTLSSVVKNRKETRLDISIDAPMIVLPLDQIDLFSSECFVLMPGVLTVQMNTLQQKEADTHDMIKITLQNTFFKYYPHYLDYLSVYHAYFLYNNEMTQQMWQNKDELMADGTLKQHRRVEILEPSVIQMDLQVLKPLNKEIRATVAASTPDDETLENIKMKIHITGFEGSQAGESRQKSKDIKLTLDPTVYKHLLEIGELFDFEVEDDEMLATNKDAILEGMRYSGWAEKANQATKIYSKNYVILSTNRLYFFKNDKESEGAYDYFSLLGCKVKRAEDKVSLRKNSLQLWDPNSKLKKMYLCFTDQTELELWFIAIGTNIRELEKDKIRKEKKKEKARQSKEAAERAKQGQLDAILEEDEEEDGGDLLNTDEDVKVDHRN
jgi:hypothetical protein